VSEKNIDAAIKEADSFFDFGLYDILSSE